jgi:D-aminoacyl-tRNA deacylase
MRAVLQRVSEAKVRVDGTEAGSIGKGLLVFLCVVKGDEDRDVEYIVKKIAQLRIFEDENGRMNRPVTEIGGSVLLVSQFTLAASVRKGNRPSFENAELPERARVLCEDAVQRLRAAGLTVATGVFAAMMDVMLVNAGPVTIILDSREGRRSGEPLPPGRDG